MIDANPVSTPAETSLYSNDEEKLTSNYPFREAVGSLMYLAVGTRPDICFAVSYISRFLENPNNSHVKAVKRIFKYIRGTLKLGIFYDCNLKLRLNCYSDADYAADCKTRRSTSGFVFSLGSGAISWSSQRQKCVALSTAESEYYAASHAVKELVWLKQLMKDLVAKCEDSILYMDNQSAIRLIKNPEFHKRTKHIDVMYHYIREKFENRIFNLTFVCTNDQLADVFTKPLAKEKFLHFRHLMKLHNQEV